MRLDIKVDLSRFEARIDELRDHVLTARTRTANTLIARAKTAGFREVSRVYGIGPRAFEQYATIRLARHGEPEAVISVRGAGLPMYHFQPRQTQRGVSVRIKGRRVLVPHAFLARMANGHVGVFARGAYGGKGAAGRTTGESFGRFAYISGSRRVKGKRKGGKGQRWSGLPINELYTFAPPDAFASDSVDKIMMDTVQDNLDKVMRHELRFALRGR